MKQVRLKEEEIMAIKSTAHKIFGKNAQVYIFGSRADKNKKGGDIDIFIETENNVSVLEEIDFLAELEMQGIERKVDLVVKTPFSKQKGIYKEAKKGVLL